MVKNILLVLLLKIFKVFSIDNHEQTSEIGCIERKHIYFLLTSSKLHEFESESLISPSNLTRCALRSACVLNPELNIHLLTMNPDLMKTEIEWIRNHGCQNNLHVDNLDIQSILHDTPIEKLYNTSVTPNLYSGAYSANNIGNALRLALLYKNGGIYMDLDIISTRSIRYLPCNAIGSQSGEVGQSFDTHKHKMSLNNAVLLFNPQSLFLLKAMKKFVADFKPDVWGHNGPNLLSRVYRSKYQYESSFKEVEILFRTVFYPIGFDTNKQVKPFYTVEASEEFIQYGYKDERTLGVHLWNHHAREWLLKGQLNQFKGWNIHPTSQASILLTSCLSELPLKEPLFNREVKKHTNYLLCKSGTYCGPSGGNNNKDDNSDR